MNLYLKTFIITSMIFVAGLVAGLYIERVFVSDLSGRTADVENSVQEIEIEMLYFQGLNESYSCTFLNEVVRKTNENLDTLADQLLGYSEKNILFTKPDITNIKQKYTYFLIKDWLLQERIKKNCGTGAVTILYFYNTENCYDCVAQGNTLTILKGQFKDKVMVFPLDIGIDVEMVDILMRNFNITSTPALVVDGKVYTGVVGKDALDSMMCSILPAGTC